MADTLELARQIPLPSSCSTLALEVEEDQSTRVNESSLPPVDEGFQAWTFNTLLISEQLSAAFLVEAIVWGFPNSFGVFLEAYLKDPEYTKQENPTSLLPLIGPLSSGIIYCLGPFINLFITRFPFHRRNVMWLGVLCCWTSLFGASYTTKLQLLVILQGALYAVGGALLYYPCISYLSEWFVRRRGLANGIIFAGTSAGGLILPLILPLLISSNGPAKALRILSIVILALLVPILPLVKGRLPELRSSRARLSGRRRLVERDLSKNTAIWIVLAANTFQGFGYFVPILWLPTFASALSINTTNASVALAMLNGASVVGRLSLGYLSDKLNPWTLAMSTLLFTSITTFILWGVLSSTFAGLMCFGVAYGLLAGGWSSLWTGFIRGIGITRKLLYVLRHWEHPLNAYINCVILQLRLQLFFAGQ
ncbi:hypothetical protein VNI00_006672 [Paramarasmius palmivorus]|uniref:MFS general substrate transporter n=1 Tax=Paramarasmius palmivorus TaxID=297713 RepID=A0AAW0DA04_9AGAR